MSDFDPSQPVDSAVSDTSRDTPVSLPHPESGDEKQTAMQRRDAVQNQRKVGQDSRQSEQNTRESSQDLREAGQDSRQSEQNTRDASQDLREASQEFQISGHALLDLEARYQLLVDSVTDYAIYMLDPEGRVATWNLGPNGSRDTRRRRCWAKLLDRLFPEDAAAGLPARELAITAREGRFETQAWRRRKDGTKFWALVTMTAIRDPNGELHGFAKVTRDLSVQKAAEEATRQFSKRIAQYQFIVENIGEFVLYTLDAEGRFTSWGSALKKAQATLPRRCWARSIPCGSTEEDGRRGAGKGVRGGGAHRALRKRCLARLEGWLTHLGHGRDRSLRGDDGKLTGFVRVGRDMTRQKRAEEELSQPQCPTGALPVHRGSVADYVIFTMDAEGRIDSWSAGARNVLGYTAGRGAGPRVLHGLHSGGD